MAKKYRVTHERKKWWEATLSGRYGWKPIAIYPSRAEAESACSAHAGGTLLVGGTKIVAEFETPE